MKPNNQRMSKKHHEISEPSAQKHFINILMKLDLPSELSPTT